MQNNNSIVTPKSFVKTLRIIHLSLVGGIVVFAIMMYLQTQNQHLSFNYSKDIMFIVLPFLAVAGIFVGNFIYNKILIGLSEKKTLKEKLNGFQTASLIKYVLIEGPALLGVVIFSNGGNQYFLFIALLLCGWLILQGPTRDKIEQGLKLEGPLKNEFQQDDRPLI